MLVHGPMRTVYCWFPSTIVSSTPVTVTNCPRWPAVNVAVPGLTVPSVVSELTIGQVTGAVEATVITSTMNVCRPLSEVRAFGGPSTRICGVSSSRFVTETSGGLRALYAGSALTAAPVTIVYGWLPSAT